MKNLIDKVFQGADKANEFIETGEERQQTLSDRHKSDMLSDNWLSKSIRPLSLLILLGVVSLVAILSGFGYSADPIIFGELVVLLGSAFGFYFDSRKREKIAAQNAKANIQIEEMKAKHEIKNENREDRHNRRMERKRLRLKRREERQQEKEGSDNV